MLISTELCIFLSSVGYVTYYIVFFWPIRYSLNLISIFNGFAGACIWTSQSVYLTKNSNAETIDRNTNIFWSFFQSSLIFGSVYFYYQFDGIEEIKGQDRIQTYVVLTIFSLIGSVLFLFPKKSEEETSSNNQTEKANPMIAFKKCFSLFKTRQMILLSISCFFTGLSQTFYQNVYSTSIAFTKYLGNDSTKLIGLYCISNGVGAIFAGLMFGWYAKRFKFMQRNRIFIYLLGNL